MKKVFISQPMTGLTKEEIEKTRKRAIDKIKCIYGDTVEILGGYFDDLGPDTPYYNFIKRSLEYLAKADIVFFARGWQNSEGCKIEHLCIDKCGIYLGVEVLYE